MTQTKYRKPIPLTHAHILSPWKRPFVIFIPFRRSYPQALTFQVHVQWLWLFLYRPHWLPILNEPSLAKGLGFLAKLDRKAEATYPKPVLGWSTVTVLRPGILETARNGTNGPTQHLRSQITRNIRNRLNICPSQRHKKKEKGVAHCCYAEISAT